MKYQLGKALLNSVLITLLLLFVSNLLHPLKAAPLVGSGLQELSVKSDLTLADSLDAQQIEALAHSGWAMANTVGPVTEVERAAQVRTLDISQAGFNISLPANNVHLSLIFGLIVLLASASLYMQRQCRKMNCEREFDKA